MLGMQPHKFLGPFYERYTWPEQVGICLAGACIDNRLLIVS